MVLASPHFTGRPHSPNVDMHSAWYHYPDLHMWQLPFIRKFVILLWSRKSEIAGHVIVYIKSSINHVGVINKMISTMKALWIK